MLVIVAVGAVTLACSGVAAWLRERESAREREFYGGRSVREWVELAIAVRTPEPTSEAARMISRIGAPAVPPLVDSLDRLRESRVHAQLVVWQTQYLPARCQWLKRDLMCPVT